MVRRAQSQETPPNESPIVTYLSNNSILIAQAIQGELTRGLSPSLSVQAQIHFFEGSVTFAGVIILIDAIGTLAGSPEFLSTVSRLVEMVIHSVVQKWIFDKLDIANFTTSIQVEVSQTLHRQRNEWRRFQDLGILMIINLILLLILLLLVISSRLSNPPPPPTFVPTITPVTGISFDLHTRATDASWISSAGNITFGGPDTDVNGFAMYRNNQKLEDGSSPVKVLEIHPQMVNDGVMTGLYPAYTVVAGEHFKAKIGFLALSDGTCGSGNVKFQLNYKEAGVLKPLGEWTDTCDGVLKDVDVDLSSIAGKNVQFALAVLANGPATQDWAVWVSPRIESP